VQIWAEPEAGRPYVLGGDTAGEGSDYFTAYVLDNQYMREREDTYTGQVKKSYGFRTDRQTRPRAIAGLVEVFSAHPQWFKDRELLGEMLTFCYNEDHRPEALAGKHDDLVMAAAIAYAVRHQQRMFAEKQQHKKGEAHRQKERENRAGDGGKKIEHLSNQYAEDWRKKPKRGTAKIPAAQDRDALGRTEAYRLSPATEPAQAE
jgi:hypothetical protein